MSRTLGCTKPARKRPRLWTWFTGRVLFTATEAPAPEERVAHLPAPAAPPGDDRITPQPRSPQSTAEVIPWVEPANQTAGPSQGGSLEFKAVVRNDPDKALKGIVQCRLTAEGLHMRQARKHDLSLGVGSRATYLEGNRFALPLGGRIVEFAVASWGVYQERLAHDLCQFLKGERPPLRAGEYTVPRYLFAMAVLPVGIPILTLGGAVGRAGIRSGRRLPGHRPPRALADPRAAAAVVAFDSPRLWPSGHRPSVFASAALVRQGSTGEYRPDGSGTGGGAERATPGDGVERGGAARASPWPSLRTASYWQPPTAARFPSGNWTPLFPKPFPKGKSRISQAACRCLPSPAQPIQEQFGLFCKIIFSDLDGRHSLPLFPRSGDEHLPRGDRGQHVSDVAEVAQ